MWHGVPVIVMHGPTFSSRVSVVYPQTAGLRRFIAKTEEDYVQAAFQTFRESGKLVHASAVFAK